ncbi:GIY-YIG nuclease family protein [Infirmifilum lucidum]|uniref:GIY-YIG nuclease family protein n=1 Tax=Infirmifilum lucidum TaxID=2776706 RepID=UPI001C3FD216|nr:GIY-YIG nuclease family protein [Infirmifilum lucidum]
MRGIYAMLIEIKFPLRFEFRKREVVLAPGLYVYVGSAKGAGGIRARVARHRRKDKKVRWHVDLVTVSPHARVSGAVCAKTAEPECILVPLLEEAGFSHVIKGFGASDCKRGCASHFLRYEGVGKCSDALLEVFREAGLEPLSLELEPAQHS